MYWGKTLDEAIRKYEEEMVPRAAKFAQRTLYGKESHFSGNGAQQFADMLRSHHKAMKAE